MGNARYAARAVVSASISGQTRSQWTNCTAGLRQRAGHSSAMNAIHGSGTDKRGAGQTWAPCFPTRPICFASLAFRITGATVAPRYVRPITTALFASHIPASLSSIHDTRQYVRQSRISYICSSSSFMWHQPRQRCKYTTSVDIQKRAIKTRSLMQNHMRAQ